jgi:hypothetical protein
LQDDSLKWRNPNTFWAAQLASTGLCAAVIHIAQQHDKVVLPEKKQHFLVKKVLKFYP